jgi:hypothetical protein
MRTGHSLSVHVRFGLGTLAGLGLLGLLALAPPAQGEPAKPAEAAKPPVVAAAAPAPAPAAAPAPAPSPAVTAEPPKRTKVTCAQYRTIAEENAKHAMFNTRLKPGSWGHLPPELHKLPKGAKLCGADGMGQIVVASPLYGQELGNHYTPLFGKVGFNPLECKVEKSMTRCSGKRHRDIAVIVTDTKNEAYVVSLFRRGPPIPLSRTGHDGSEARAAQP